MQKYQLENPNNARVYIDYRKENKVNFEYVGKDNQFKIVFNLWLKLWIKYPLYVIPVFSIFPLAFVNSLEVKLIGLFLCFFSMFGIPLVLTYITLKTEMIKQIPHLQTIGSTKYKVELIPEDLKENKFEIPLFKNILMDYIATEEFSKYLERVEIIEHPFNLYIKNKKKPNQFLWKGIFYFSEKPKTGELKIIFS